MEKGFWKRWENKRGNKGLFFEDEKRNKGLEGIIGGEKIGKMIGLEGNDVRDVLGGKENKGEGDMNGMRRFGGNLLRGINKLRLKRILVKDMVENKGIMRGLRSKKMKERKKREGFMMKNKKGRKKDGEWIRKEEEIEKRSEEKRERSGKGKVEVKMDSSEEENGKKIEEWKNRIFGLRERNEEIKNLDEEDGVESGRGNEIMNVIEGRKRERKKEEKMREKGIVRVEVIERIWNGRINGESDGIFILRKVEEDEMKRKFKIDKDMLDNFKE